MKNLIYFILMFIGNGLLAQTSKLDSIFIELDHSQMHTNYLWDKQIRFVDPMLYNGASDYDSLMNPGLITQLSNQFSYSNVIDSSKFKP
jgi:hypothetical protein